MKRAIGVALILGMILLIPAYPGAETTDPDPVNIEWVNLRWDFRDYGSLGTYNWIGGSRLRTGAFFVFECEVVTGGLLDKIGDVIRVVAVNTSSNREYILHYEPFIFLGNQVQYWILLAQPDESMFVGGWEFNLYYNGSDNDEHQQSMTISPPEKAFPAKIGNVEVSRFEANFLRIAWSGIGEPGPENDFNYQVLVFDAEGVDVIAAYSVDWVYGYYNSFFNKAVFFIPRQYAGRNYSIRLASGIFTNRSLYYMKIPKLD